MTPPLMSRLLPLLVAVSLVHWATLSWLREQFPPVRPLVQMAEPLFTRLLQPAAPPATQTLPTSPAPSPQRKTASTRTVEKSPAASPPVAAASAPESETRSAAALPDSPKPVDAPPAVATAADTLPAETVAAGTPPADAPPEPPSALAQTAAPAPDPLGSWPLDTRLSYRLGGFYQSELHGSARVQWQRDKSSYQVRLSVSAAGLTLATLTSQGEATPAGLLPRVYEEQVPGGLRRADFGDGFVRFQDGREAVLPAGAQDTVSQFVELAHRFSTGRTVLAAGVPVRVWLGRPGGLDEWVYDVGDVETLQTPQLGAIAAFHLTPRPLANPRGAITAELWFAPSLQYLPVRVRVTLGKGNFVDLMIDKIEQAEVPRIIN